MVCRSYRSFNPAVKPTAGLIVLYKRRELPIGAPYGELFSVKFYFVGLQKIVKCRALDYFCQMCYNKLIYYV